MNYEFLRKKYNVKGFDILLEAAKLIFPNKPEKDIARFLERFLQNNISRVDHRGVTVGLIRSANIFHDNLAGTYSIRQDYNMYLFHKGIAARYHALSCALTEVEARLLSEKKEIEKILSQTGNIEENQNQAI
jgi:hypothetical protein